MITPTRLRPRVLQVTCDGHGLTYGPCYNKAQKPDWKGRYGGKALCPDCAKRFQEENAYWAWITR